MNLNDRSVSIIGCGWLGHPLGKELVAHGWVVKGTTTQKEKIQQLQADGIEAFEVQLPQNSSAIDRLLESEYLVLNIPPGRRNSNQLGTYAQSIEYIMERALSLNAIKKIIFISSTSVYGAEADIVDESTPCQPKTASGKEILRAETIIKQANIPHIVLRFGGLAGPGRHPGRFLAGRENLTNGHQSVNFLHLEDTIKVIEIMLSKEFGNEVFNVVAPIHPNKKGFYVKMAKMINETPPKFSTSIVGKRNEICADKLLNATGFKYTFPNPMHFKFS